MSNLGAIWHLISFLCIRPYRGTGALTEDANRKFGGLASKTLKAPTPSSYCLHFKPQKSLFESKQVWQNLKVSGSTVAARKVQRILKVTQSVFVMAKNLTWQHITPQCKDR